MIDRLRQELRRITSETRVLAEACRVGRVPDRVTDVAMTFVPTVAQELAARANHRRLLLWRDALTSVLRRRGIAAADLERSLDELAVLVLLQRRDVGTITRPRWIRDFNDALDRVTIELERTLKHHVAALTFPRLQPRRQHVLRLQVESGRGTRWRVFGETMGLEAEEIVVAPFAEHELQQLFEQHCGPGDGLIRDASGLDAMRRFGQRLHHALFSGCVGALYEYARSEAVRSACDLRLEVAALGAECRSVPWEALYDGIRFLSTSSEMLLSRSVGRSDGAAPELLPRPLRVLLTVSSPLGVDVIDADRARRTIEVALAPLVLLGLLELDVSADGSIDGLRRRLCSAEADGRPHHVWHFVGHGEYNSVAGHDELILRRRDGEAHPVTTSDLAAVFANHPSLRLVVLNACREGSAVRDRSWRAAAALLEAGVQTVVAMQFELSYAASSVFDQEVYGWIADGASVDQAIVAARRALIDVPNYGEWITPVIFHNVTGAAR